MVHIIDTHALVWFLEGNTRLGEKARSALTTRGDRIVVPAIVLAEIAFLFARRRVDVSFMQVVKHIESAENSSVFPINEVVIERLPTALNIHDGLIVATALVFRDLLSQEVDVVTKDGEISHSAIIPTVW